MRYPEFIENRGKIGFIAPSFGATIEPYKTLFDSALEFFGENGYETVLGPNCHENKGVGKSNTAEKCAEEINDFFCNDKCNAILSCGGGETMCEDLPFVDFERIAKSEPKWFMGYSDNTNLTFLLPVLCDIAAIYGPCAPSFGQKPIHESLTDALKIIQGKKTEVRNYEKWELTEKESINPLEPYNCTEKFNMKMYRGSSRVSEAEIEGRLTGGCLDCLDNLCGTKFDKVRAFNERYEKDGIIWFIETCDFSPMDTRRSLWHLKNAGWFDNAKGFLVGRPMRYNEKFMGMDHQTAVLDMLSDLNVPVIFDLDIGHLPPMMPIITGAFAQVHAYGNSFQMKYMFV